MSLVWVILGTFGQLVLMMFFFMLAAFAGGGMANGGNLSRFGTFVIGVSMVLLPGSCVVSAGVVIYAYVKDWGPQAYYYYLWPLAVLALYLLLMPGLSKKK
ncbi:MAG: hypothetical protein RL748_2965 [Pseudomonadota bacterium]